MVLLQGARSKIQLPTKYVVWGALFAMSILTALIINEVNTGSIFYGLRKYFKYLAVFLLPFAFRFSEHTIVRQLQCLALLGLIQLPVVFYQWRVDLPVAGTPDVVIGTLSIGSQLAAFLLSSLAILTAFYVKGKVRLPVYVVVAAWLVLPTWMNETTGTMFLLPLAVLLPLLFGGAMNKENLRKFMPVFLVLVTLFVGFVVSYTLQFDRWGKGGITSIFTGEGLAFLYKKADENSQDFGKMREIGRIDSFLLPFKVHDDPVLWISGVGIGNASTTFHPIFEGEYTNQAVSYGVDFTTLSALFWELGLVGLALSFLFLYFVFRDAAELSKRPDAIGALALGWMAVVAMLPMIFAWKNIVDHNANSYLMWLMCGYVAAHRFHDFKEHARQGAIQLVNSPLLKERRTFDD